MTKFQSVLSIRYNLNGAIAVFVFALVVALGGCSSEQKQEQSNAPIHETTEWKFVPSEALDALSAFNVLTSDTFYVSYYPDEHPWLTNNMPDSIKHSLTNIKNAFANFGGGILSANLCMIFSAGPVNTLDDLFWSLDNLDSLEARLQQTDFYAVDFWLAFVSVSGDIRAVLLYLKTTPFQQFWKEEVTQIVSGMAASIQPTLVNFNVLPKLERRFHYRMDIDTITIFMLYFARPHALKVTQSRFLMNQDWPFRIVVRSAVHELAHPPFDWKNDTELRETFETLKADKFLMNKIKLYANSMDDAAFADYVEEDCVQALDQVVCEEMRIGYVPKERWKTNDSGAHVLAAVIYYLMQREKYDDSQESYRDFLVRMIKTNRLRAGFIEPLYLQFIS